MIQNSLFWHPKFLQLTQTAAVGNSEAWSKRAHPRTEEPEEVSAIPTPTRL